MKAIYAESANGGTEAFVIIKDDRGNFYRVLGTPELLGPEHADISAMPGFSQDLEDAGVEGGDIHNLLVQLGV